MASIHAQIELFDMMSAPINHIISAVTQMTSHLQGVDGAINGAFDTAAVDEVARSISLAQSQLSEFTARINRPPPPIPAPQWQSANMNNVFTGNGMERFQQETTATNNAMEQMMANQRRISQLSTTTNVFPSRMITDLQAMNTRIEGLRTRITQINNNPIDDMGANAVNNDIERLNNQLRQALAAQNDITRAMDRMDVSSANAAYSRLNNIVDNTDVHIRENMNAQNQFNRSVNQGSSGFGGMGKKLLGVAAAYASIQTVDMALNVSDSMSQTTARLSMVVDDGGSVEALEDKIFASSQRSRTDYMATANVVAQLGQRAPDAFTNNNETIAFAENLNKSFVVAGASQQEIASASLQLTQALGSGVLRGEELNAVFEAAPNVIQTIADYMGVPIGEIRNMASEGLISADIVKNAMLGATEDIDEAFNSMPMTFAQVGTSIKNESIRAFEPMLQGMNDIANSANFNKLVTGVISALVVIASITMGIFNALASCAGFVIDNWSIIEPFVIGAAVILGIYTAALLIHKGILMKAAIAAKISAFVESVKTAKTLLATGATIAGAAATTTATSAQIGFNAVLLACPLVWIVIAIIAVIVAIFAVVAAFNKFAGTSISAIGVIAGVFMWLGALMVNILIGTINAIIQFMWNSFVEPFISIIEFVLNVFGGGFDSFGDGIANLIGQIISMFLSFGKIATTIIDAIFGTDWTGGLNAMQDEVLGWGKNDSAITLSREAPTIDHRFDMTDAYDVGYDFGVGIDDKIGGMFGGASEPSYDETFDVSAVDPYSETIADNTGAMADSTEISDENLQYLRDIAERETVNRYTTAEIKVEMGGIQNNVNSTMDLDGMVSDLVEKLEESSRIVADGG